MSDTNLMNALILASGMATAGGLVFDELPKTKGNFKVPKSGSLALNKQHPQPNSDLGSGLNHSLYRMAAWFKGSEQHSISAIF